MNITFGKHTGKSLELVLIKEPDYISWVVSKSDAYGALAKAQERATELIEQFDKKPIVYECDGQNCRKPATYCTAYTTNVGLVHWWCDDCDPYQLGAVDGKLHRVATYHDALEHVALYCENRIDDLKQLIRSIAEAKGLPKRVGEKQACNFFK